MVSLTNKREIVLGYFNVSSISEKRFMLVAQNKQGGKLNGLFEALNNRSPLLEPTPVTNGLTFHWQSVKKAFFKLLLPHEAGGLADND
ncbi:MAG: hypothetical protein ACI9V1_001260 [Spirosomataceae bacterium]|jgi:hypothetical protein